MRVRIGRLRGLRKTIERPGKSECGEVGDGKRGGQGGTIRQAPRAERTARRGGSEVLTDPKVPQLCVPSFAAFPLVLDHGAQTMPYPLIQLLPQ
jgi:hypothetical protein